MPDTKADFLKRTKRYWNPGKTAAWQDFGVDLVIDRRQGYFLYDMDGRRLIDVHLNGGTYNLGHRNPEIVAALKDGLDHFDIGNHHFPSLKRTELAQALAACTPADLQHTIYASGGGEAIDIALKTARHATQRRKIVSIEHCYHGHTGLALACGDDRFSRLFLSHGAPDVFQHVPFNDLGAMEHALAPGDVACVIMETIPATYGFPLPADGYLQAVKALCERHGTLYIADEVQTGLMRCGAMWAIDTYDVQPDILVTAKGLSGGLYPIAAVVAAARCAGWLTEDGFGHMSTFGGAELGCIAALKTLEITQRPEVRDNVRRMTELFATELEAIRARHADFFIAVRQRGVVIGLEFDHPQGAKFVMKALYENGVWAIFSTLDPRILQFKPGLLCDRALCDEILERLDTAIGLAAAEAR